MKKSIVVLAFVLLVIVLAFVLLRQDGVDVRGSWVRGRSVAAATAVSSYRYSSTVTSESEGLLEGAPVVIESWMEGTGVIDRDGRFMYTPVTINVRGSVEENPVRTETQIEMYVTGDTLYSKAGQRWVKQTLGEDAWSNTQLDRRNRVIENAVVEIIGSGGEVYEVDFRPLPHVLADYAVEVSGSTPSLNAEFNSESITSYTVRELISKESYLPVKTVIEFTMVSGGITTNMSIVTGYYDYNMPVDIELPEETAGAIEV